MPTRSCPARRRRLVSPSKPPGLGDDSISGGGGQATLHGTLDRLRGAIGVDTFVEYWRDEYYTARGGYFPESIEEQDDVLDFVNGEDAISRVYT